jgi:hypothetical protein
VSDSVVISAFATWTSGGVSVGRAPLAEAGRALGPWPEAPELARIHPRARRPHASAKVLVQLAHALIAHRESRPGASLRASTGLAIGSVAGCAAADVDFLAGLDGRGLSFGSPATFVYTLPTAPPGEVSIALGLKGPLFTVSAGQGSGLSAVVIAAAQVAAGRCDACLCGRLEVNPPGATAGDSVSLFLLERGEGWPRLSAWREGFGTAPFGPAASGEPLHALARAAADSKAGESLVTSVSPEGYWVSVVVSRNPSARTEKP